MACSGDPFRSACGAYIHPCQSGHQRRGFQPGNCHPHLRGGADVLGHGILTHAQDGLRTISTRSWIFLILSGLATGASWLCYYRALQIGDVSKVVPVDKLSVVFTMILAFVFLHEKFTPKSILGAILITAGTLLMVL